MDYEADAQVREEKTQKETDAKCPNCGATIQFDPATGHMHCEYCGYERVIPPAEEGKAVEELDFLTAEHTASHEWGAKKKVVVCKCCGAESVYDELQTSDVCPYCGATQVMPAQDDDSMAPGGVAPFEISKEQASENFEEWLKGRLFTPRAAKESCKAEAMNGIYLPYWTYDTKTVSNWTGEAGYEYEETDSDGDSHTETRWKKVRGLLNLPIDDELVCGSTRHEKDILDSILPFEHEKLVPYKPEYVAGFVSERYSVGLKDGWETARAQIDEKIKEAIRQQIIDEYDADDASVGKVSTVYDDITFKYVLFPIWMSSFKYKDKVYQFMVNGQTGQVGGKAPVSALRVIIAILIAIGAIWLLFSLFSNC